MLNAAPATPELSFLVDRALAARGERRLAVADGLARAAETVLKAAYPKIAADIAHAASRKGQGAEIGARLVEHLDASSAACVALVLMLRGSRQRVIEALSLAFGRRPEFLLTMKMLCGRVLDKATEPKLPGAVAMARAPTEVAAPAVR